MAKKELTLNEFRTLIREEAEKFKARVVLENEKRALEAELKELMSESYVEEYDTMDEEIEEGIGKMLGLTDSPEKVEERKKALVARVEKLKGLNYTNFSSEGQKMDEAGFMQAMEKNGFSGQIIPEPKSATMIYKPGRYGASRLGSGGASQGLGI